MRNYRDLLFFTSHLKRWQTNMDSFDTMLAARQQAYQERLPRILDRYNLDYIDSLNTRYTGLAQRVDAIRQNENALALADNQERQYLAILKRVEQRIGLLNDFPGDDVQEYQDKYQRLYGVLTWNIRTDFKPRLHQVSKSLNQTRRTLGQVKRSQASLQQAQREAPQRFNDFRNRIDTLTQRIDVLADKLDGLSQRQVQAIRDLAVRKLQAHQAKLEDYKVRAQFAMAQIYDLTATSPTVETRDPGEDSPSQTEPPTTRQTF
jgi:chromosome segregation ATPase